MYFFRKEVQSFQQWTKRPWCQRQLLTFRPPWQRAERKNGSPQVPNPHSSAFTVFHLCHCSRYFPDPHIAYFNLIPLLAPEQAAYHTGSSSRPRLDGNNIIINKQIKSWSPVDNLRDPALDSLHCWASVYHVEKVWKMMREILYPSYFPGSFYRPTHHSHFVKLRTFPQ